MLGKRLRYLREKKKLSQLELAKKLNMPNQNISNYEREFRQPDYDTLNKLADFFGVTVDYLLGRSDHPKLSEKEDIDADDQVKELLDLLKDKPDDERKRLEERILAYAKGLTDASDD